MALTRNPSRVLKNIVKMEDGGLVTKKPCRIQAPERWLERHMAVLGAEVFTAGLVCIIMEDEYYGCLFVDSMIRLTPSNTETVMVGDVPYLEFQFEAGDQLLYTTDLVMNDTLTYYIYDEMINKGRIPWYIEYLDFPYIFESADYHAGINLGNPRVLEFLLSTIARNPDKMMELYRHVMSSVEYTKTNPPALIPFKSVIWNTSGTVSKLIGGYFSDSITSALVNPSEKVERIEELLRA